MNSHFVFDFDGIIANSNALKENVLSKILSDYFSCSGNSVTKIMRKFPGQNRKFYISKMNRGTTNSETDFILDKVGKEMRNCLFDAEMNPFIIPMRSCNENVKWFIITSGNEEEAREYLKIHKISHFFTDVVGGESDKFVSYVRIMKEYKLNTQDLVVIGDGEKDYDLIKEASCLGVLITQWSQQKNLLESINFPRLKVLQSFDELNSWYRNFFQ